MIVPGATGSAGLTAIELLDVVSVAASVDPSSRGWAVFAWAPDMSTNLTGELTARFGRPGARVRARASTRNIARRIGGRQIDTHQAAAARVTLDLDRTTTALHDRVD